MPWLRVNLERLHCVCGVKVWNRELSPNFGNAILPSLPLHSFPLPHPTLLYIPLILSLPPSLSGRPFKALTVMLPLQLSVHLIHCLITRAEINQRFQAIRFEVSESIADLQSDRSLCAEQIGVLLAGAVQYYPCNQGGVLVTDRSRLFMVGQYVQLRMFASSSTSKPIIHTIEVEVHGY